MKPNSKWSVLFVAAASVLLFTESCSQENSQKQQEKSPDQNAVKRPGMLESFIGAVLQFLLGI